MSFILAACLTLAAADEVTVKPLRGEAARGTLLKLSEKGATIRTSKGEQQWDAAAIQSVSVQPVKELPESPTTNPLVLFVDGSQVPCTRFRLNQGQVQIESPNRLSIDAASAVVRAVKYRKQDAALSEQWDAIAAAASASDKLVVRKSAAVEGADESEAKMVLDNLDGVVHAIADDKISFEFDGDKIEVPLEKVEGIIFHNRRPERLPDSACLVRDIHGGEWQIQTLQREADGKLVMTSVAGVKLQLPWSDVVELDFSSGNVTYLSDLKPEAAEWRPYLVTSATPPALAKWFGVRHDQASDGSAITLGERSFDKGLSIHSRTSLTYRLTREYRHLQAVVGIDERFRGPANLRLVVTGDNRELFARDIRGVDPAFEMDVDVTGVRRLRILVDFGADRSDVGDHLLLGDAKLTK